MQTDKSKDLIVISADTIIEINNQILEKPKDPSHAFQMLRSLSGKSHFVHTAVCMYVAGKGSATAESEYDSFVETTKVQFIDLKDEDIQSYVDTGEGVDKSGSYGIQGKILLLKLKKYRR